MDPARERPGLRRYHRVKDAIEYLHTKNSFFMFSEDINNPRRPGSKTFWVGTFRSLFHAMRRRATAFYEILPPGETCLYGDIDLKVDTPFDDNDRRPPDTLLALIGQAGFRRHDLDATCVDFTEREARLGGRWMRLAFNKAICKLVKVKPNKKLEIRWTDASRRVNSPTTC